MLTGRDLTLLILAMLRKAIDHLNFLVFFLATLSSVCLSYYIMGAGWGGECRESHGPFPPETLNITVLSIFIYL